jgi:nitrous oxide reductase accessory protein NosL
MRFLRKNITIVKTASCFVFVLLLFLALSPAPAAEREGCVLCGMYLDIYAKTRYTITLDDGSSKSTCSLACAARIMNEHKGRIRDVKTADYLTGKLIDARSAFILEGSDVPGVMSNTSRIAFPSKKAAQDFRKKHGGRIITFDEAVRNELRERE